MFKGTLFTIGLCIVLIAQLKVYGQNQNPYDPLPKILPPTPEAAQLERYGDGEVNLFHGEPIITIPIYTLAGNKLSIPVSLSYNAGGFRVSDLSTDVGLGWNLVAGGMITRNIRGQSDFKGPVGRQPINLNTFDPVFESNQADYNTALTVMANNFDTEPDIFNYNFGVKSGRFVFNDDLSAIYTIPFDRIKIERLPGDPNIQNDESFVITDEAGVKYFFEAFEFNNPSEDCTIGFANNREIGGSNLVNWKLTKVLHPLGEYIELQYENYTYMYREGKSEVRYKLITPQNSCDPGAFNAQERFCTR
ncbi:MAG TPA: hypothetical protein VEB42_13065, partial [Chitinophagaceae bacterium]|nr:hypothetical protein [Chitinophagaceae bacterium]